jgi:hypothetical protein
MKELENNNMNKNIPKELWGIWYQRVNPYYDPGIGFTHPYIDIEFTETQFCNMDDVNKFPKYLARVKENKRIEYTNSNDPDFSHPKTLCDSYTISDGTLTFYGGDYNNRTYRKERR